LDRQLKIALIGQAAFAEKVLEKLHSRGEEIVHVFAPPDVSGGRADPLKTKALELKLPLSQPASFKGEAAYEHFRSLDADLAILAFVTIIVPDRILYAPRLKSICFHPSLLPRHRGASAINWAIIQGDDETGVTVFWPDKGIDAGPIILQKRAPIGEDDTTGSLYFEKLFPLGVDAVLEAVDLIARHEAPAIVQDESQATYEPPCRDPHAKVDFSKPARAVYNLIRGCDPQPGAFVNVSDKKLRFYEVALEGAISNESPGKIIGIDQDGMRIALDGGTLKVKRVRLDPEAKKVAPLELKNKAVLAEGAELG
jgi:methionyl-tRNA formyltransferase